MIKLFLKEQRFLLNGLIDSVYLCWKGYLRPIWNGHDKWLEDQFLQILRHILVSIRRGTGKARTAQSQDGLLWKIVSFLPLR